MGTKRKIPMEKRETREQRSVAFSKRRKGLFKKASELCLQFDARIAVLASPPSERRSTFYSFGHDSVDSVIDCFLQNRPPSLPPARVSGVSAVTLDQVAEVLWREKRKNEGLGFVWDWEVEDADDDRTRDELIATIGRFQNLREKVLSKLNRSGSAISGSENMASASGLGCSVSVSVCDVLADESTFDGHGENDFELQHLLLDGNIIVSSPTDGTENDSEFHSLVLDGNGVSSSPTDCICDDPYFQSLLDGIVISSSPMDGAENDSEVQCLVLDSNGVSSSLVDSTVNDSDFQCLFLDGNGISISPTDSIWNDFDFQNLFLDDNGVSGSHTDSIWNDYDFQNLFLDDKGISKSPVDSTGNDFEFQSLSLDGFCISSSSMSAESDAVRHTLSDVGFQSITSEDFHNFDSSDGQEFWAKYNDPISCFDSSSAETTLPLF